jgi:3-oxoacyl-[acyl-carrier-protein] synthase II
VVQRASRRVAVTGLGVVSAVGVTVPEFFASLVEGRSGVGRLPWRDDAVGALAEFEGSDHFTRLELGSLDRFAQFAVVAAKQAVDQSAIPPAELATARVGVYFGSGIGGMATMEAGYKAFFAGDGRISPMSVVLTMSNAAAAHLSMRYSIRGPSLTYAVACASSTIAIGEAYRAIRDGYIDIAIVGGAEAILVPGMVAAWSAMRVLAPPDASNPECSCRPFSARRAGLVLGEGAGALVLEALDGARVHGRTPLAEIAGYGVSCDATHLAKPDAAGQASAMRAALSDANLEPSDIGYINAHGTATPVGDVVETQSIREVFGGLSPTVPVSSTKALHGHLLGASGAVELIAALMALQTRTLPPTCHLDEPDPHCDLDYVANRARREVTLQAVMSNSFAFGGTNAVLIARRLPDE